MLKRKLISIEGPLKAQTGEVMFEIWWLAGRDDRGASLSRLFYLIGRAIRRDKTLRRGYVHELHSRDIESQRLCMNSLLLLDRAHKAVTVNKRTIEIP